MSYIVKLAPGASWTYRQEDFVETPDIEIRVTEDVSGLALDLDGVGTAIAIRKGARGLKVAASKRLTASHSKHVLVTGPPDGMTVRTGRQQ